MKLAPQTTKCFALGCTKGIISPEKDTGEVADTSSWIRDVRFGWLTDIDRWFCPSHLARIAQVREQLPVAIQELHSYALLAAIANADDGRMVLGVRGRVAAEVVDYNITHAHRRVEALRLEEAALLHTEEV